MTDAVTANVAGKLSANHMREFKSSITNEHVKFARGVVALARELGMNNLKLSFDASGETGWRDKNHVHSHRLMRLEWREGRHGAASDIEMWYEETNKVTERIDV